MRMEQESENTVRKAKVMEVLFYHFVLRVEVT